MDFGADIIENDLLFLDGERDFVNLRAALAFWYERARKAA